MSAIPSQDDHNPNDPRQHAMWALRNLPMVAGVGAITHPAFLADWSEHLWKCGFRHVDWIRELADEDGNVNVSRLPAQEIRLHQAFRGQRHDMNPAARWAEKDAPEPKPVRIPDIRQLTEQENRAMIAQYVRDGWIKDGSPGPSEAEEFNE
ncbi:hypothetical protein SEA_SUPERCALLIE99_32 [Mycobacterium phage SuperCallie99]|uniref:Minor tail protein n=7 Tax=Caudoviricetes TaxID=2731619 RepID=A0A7G9A197_9CAUD|nr:minor tail protein [Mycobacterium phage VohminGhazi]YP_009637836.1 minor tail protein [Mycobacterium phage EricB]YP_010061165.1 minor tail protein [Mycobacterium phage JewelBug]AEK08475.1 hypothetical protein PBI_DAVINCI_32 [Mycobacterium phage DaVinci]AMQ66866.1 hypothetical protein PBI_MCFLY_32 [Mycobacterium phage McFly]AMW64380.1 hypothetical protein PBI_KAZAN_32 [Mycobacterium phage Kazan]AOT24771.1 hypothetical protein PBI_ISIPHIWO_32 [Mycobacterium phage Isiphiwo]AVP42155.1 hypothe